MWSSLVFCSSRTKVDQSQSQSTPSGTQRPDRTRPLNTTAKEEDTEEEDIGKFWGGMEDPGSVARVGREEAGEDHEMWADLDSMQNSKVEAVPII